MSRNDSPEEGEISSDQQETENTDILVVKSQRGKDQLIYQGHQYNYDKDIEGSQINFLLFF